MRAGGASCARKKAAARSRRHFLSFSFFFRPAHLLSALRAKLKGAKF
jgi:hypothetical protein